MNFIKKWFTKRSLDKEQKEINELYNKDGLTDEVLERQIALNIERNELNLPDTSELNDEGFAQ